MRLLRGNIPVAKHEGHVLSIFVRDSFVLKVFFCCKIENEFLAVVSLFSIKIDRKEF